jgi:DNA-binding winged helix-turn-helix (wHTH) protein
MGAGAEVEHRFAEFVLDHRRGCLRRGAVEIELRPKCFQALRYLAQNAGRLVSKDEMIQAVWPKMAVTDESLSRCMCDLRLALQDRDQAIIKTVRGRGFLFAGPPAPNAQSAQATDDVPASRSASSDRTGKRAEFSDLALPLIDQIISTSALRGAAYEGFYESTRPYAAMPGKFIHDQILVRMGPDGVLRLKMGTGGVYVDGWVLPVHTQLYVIGTEFGTGGLVFAILHGVSSIKAQVLDGITLSSTFDVARTPAASTIVLNRVGELTADPDADDARLTMLGARNPVADRDSVPDALRRHLARDVGALIPELERDGVLRLPLGQSKAQSLGFDAK